MPLPVAVSADFRDWDILEADLGVMPCDKALFSRAPRGVPGANGGLLAARADPGKAGLPCGHSITWCDMS